jgi:hypothetical protein
VRPATINRRVDTLELRTKGPDQIGLQLADLVVSSIARSILGKPTHEDFEVVRSKFRRSPDGHIEGAGLVTAMAMGDPVPEVIAAVAAPPCRNRPDVRASW